VGGGPYVKEPTEKGGIVPRTFFKPYDLRITGSDHVIYLLPRSIWKSRIQLMVAVNPSQTRHPIRELVTEVNSVLKECPSRLEERDRRGRPRDCWCQASHGMMMRSERAASITRHLPTFQSRHLWSVVADDEALLSHRPCLSSLNSPVGLPFRTSNSSRMAIMSKRIGHVATSQAVGCGQELHSRSS